MLYTTTAVITYLMIFIIQYAQNRGSMAMHLKLAEIIRTIVNADNTLCGPKRSLTWN